MGRPSPKQKKSKRKRQKARRKLEFSKMLSKCDENADHGSPSEPSHESEQSTSCMGDVDTDVMEMSLYDSYRKLDGEQYTPRYLFKCREKLMIKVKQYRAHIHDLKREVAKVKLESNEEKERLRKYYEVIAFGKSRSGKIVRDAMGTAHAAGKIIQELKALYSVENDSDSD